MKLNITMLLAVMAMATSQAYSATRVFNITGATAFRASANNAIISLLGGSGTTVYAYTGTQGVAGTNRAIFKGTMPQFPGDTIIVRASWSGSTTGIRDLADGTSIQFLDDVANDANLTTIGQRLGETGDPTPVFETAVARWAFSDVDKLLSERPNAPLAGGPIGVVPFMFLAGEGAPAELNNMTDQIHETLWTNGQLPISFFTGNTSDETFILATGRNNGSGTRASILSETGYGSFRNVVQFGATFQGTRTDAFPTGKLLAITEFENSGYTSNSNVRDVLTRRSDDITFGGDPVDALFVSYLTISDAQSAITEGAQEMTYNGSSFSPENVKNGNYTLWGYQQFYQGASPTGEETTFDTAFRAAIPGTLDGVNAIAITDMTVNRSGGDGGPIFPQE